MTNALGAGATKARATLLLQFKGALSRDRLMSALNAISSEILLVDHCTATRLAVVAVPDPVPADVVNALALLPALRWLEADCGCFARLLANA
jgi:hypothetical protein